MTKLKDQGLIQCDEAAGTFSIHFDIKNSLAPPDSSLSDTVKVLSFCRPNQEALRELSMWASHAQEILSKDIQIEGKDDLLAGMQVWQQAQQSHAKAAHAIAQHRNIAPRINPVQSNNQEALDQLRAHREPLIKRLKGLGLSEAKFAKAHAVLTRTLSMDHWVDDRLDSLRDLRMLLKTLVEPVDMLLLPSKRSLCTRQLISEKSLLKSPDGKNCDTDPIT